MSSVRKRAPGVETTLLNKRLEAAVASSVGGEHKGTPGDKDGQEV